jgi:REP element-mobilizing transposase RayT
MANTYTSLHYHIIFSTKNRHPWIHADIEQRIWEYLGGIARQNDMKAIQIGGIEDHVHVVLGAPIAPSLRDVINGHSVTASTESRCEKLSSTHRPVPLEQGDSCSPIKFRSQVRCLGCAW